MWDMFHNKVYFFKIIGWPHYNHYFCEVKTKIKISSVNNLTDARYFAAWGVDFIGFDINPESPAFLSPPLLKEISEWVEGPQIVLEAGKIEDENWLLTYLEQNPTSFLQWEYGYGPIEGFNGFEVSSLQSRNDNLRSENIVIQSTIGINAFSAEDLQYLSDIRISRSVYLDVPFSHEEWDDFMNLNLDGLVLRGGLEEKTGFKSYDELDLIFENIPT